MSPGYDDQDALMASSALLVVVAPDLTVLNATQAYLEATHRERAAVVGRSLLEVFPERPSEPGATNPQAVRTSIEAAARTRRPDRVGPLRYDVQRPDGGFDERYWNLTSSPVLGPDGEIRAIVHHAEEVTAQVTLKRREASILESFTDAFFALDRDWRFTYVNAHAENLLGHRSGDLLGTTVWEAFPGVVGSEFETIYRRTADERAPLSITEYYPDHDRWYEAHTHPGTPGGITVYFRDVSERIAAEKRLRENEERYRTLFESIDEGFCVIDLVFGADGEAEDFRYLEINPAFEGLTGLSPEVALSGKTVRQMIPEYEDFWIETYGRVARTGRPESATSEVKGLNRWFEVSAARVGGPGSSRVGVVFNDITVRVRAEQERERLLGALRAEREKLRSVFEQAPAFMALLRGDDFTFEYANQAYVGLVGGRDLIGKTLLEALPEVANQGFFDLLRNVVATGEPFVGREIGVRLQRAPGEEPEERFLDFVYQPVREADGTIDAVLTHGVDVSDQVAARRKARVMNEELEAKVAERTRELQEAIREAEGFNYSIAHDLRAPLRAISSTASLLLQDLGTRLDEADRELLERQSFNAGRLGRLIDELLRLSRLSRVEVRREAIDMTAKARSVAEELDPARRIEVQEGMAAAGDKGLVRTVFQNLIGNAFKFSPDASIVRVGQTDSAFWVRDAGVGFDMKYADKLFLPFVRLVTEEEFEGTGIGLANVERIVRRHGGRVWVESALGEGAAFFFTLGG